MPESPSNTIDRQAANTDLGDLVEPAETKLPDQAFVRLNRMTDDDARETLIRCCGAARWVDAMVGRRPFVSNAHLWGSAAEVWADMDENDLLEAFAHHPRIGEDLDALRAKFATTSAMAELEQAGVASADETTLIALRDANTRYFERFGFIFIVCATGKRAAEMLALLRERLDNDRANELAIAAREQAEITRLRLETLSS